MGGEENMVRKILVNSLLALGIIGTAANLGMRVLDHHQEGSVHLENSVVASFLGYERYSGSEEMCFPEERLYVRDSFLGGKEITSPSLEEGNSLSEIVAYTVSPKMELKASLVALGLGGLLYLRNKRKNSN